MRKMLIPIVVALALVLGFAATMAQDASPVATDQHPFVGTWLFDANAEDPANAPDVVRVSADGGYIAANAAGLTTLGVWEATGERTAIVTVTSTGVDETGAPAGTFVLRTLAEVNASGDAFTASYTSEVVDPDGTGTGQAGPTTATATRLTPEPMGTPVAGTPAG
jgi:hypothetical protein